MIIEINEKGLGRAVSLREAYGKPTPRTIPTIIRYIKAGVTKEIQQQYSIKRTIWQKNYYEHIIRNEKELLEILEYIDNNPINWEEDELNELPTSTKNRRRGIRK